MVHLGGRPRHPVRRRARHLPVDVLYQRAAQGDVHELHAAADPQHRQVPPAGLRDQGDLRIGALLAHDLEGKALALAVPAGADVGPTAGQHQSGQAVQDGATACALRDEGRDARDTAGPLARRPPPRLGAPRGRTPAHEPHRDLGDAVRDRAEDAGHAKPKVGGRIGAFVLFSRPGDGGQTDRQGHDHRHHPQRDVLHVIPPKLIVPSMPTLFRSLYTISASVARRPHFTPSASTASLGIRSRPFCSYFASERKTSALTARRLAGETVASARRRDGPLFLESQNSSGLLKIHSAVMRSLRTQRKPAARSARSIAPALPKRKKSGAPRGGWNASWRSRERRTIPKVLTLLCALQTATATRPSGTSTRCISASARSASGISMSPNRQTTRAKGRSAKVRRSASISWNCTFRTPRARVRARARRSMVGEKSTPATKPRGPTLRAMVRAGSPGPVATSSTHMPERIPAISTSRRPNGRNSGRTTSV